MGMAELEKSRVEAETELEQLRAQKAFITNEVIALKENLTKVFYHPYRIVSSNTKDRLLFVTCELNSASSCLPQCFSTKRKNETGANMTQPDSFDRLD